VVLHCGPLYHFEMRHSMEVKQVAYVVHVSVVIVKYNYLFLLKFKMNILFLYLYFCPYRIRERQKS